MICGFWFYCLLDFVYVGISFVFGFVIWFCGLFCFVVYFVCLFSLCFGYLCFACFGLGGFWCFVCSV